MSTGQSKRGYQYQHIYEGRCVSLIPFDSKTEALKFFREQAGSLGPNDSTRLRVINLRNSRPLRDTWGLPK